MLIQVILVLVLLSAFAITWKRASQSVISRTEAVMWSALWIVAGVVILLPNTTTVIANIVGVGRGVDLVVYAAVTLLFVLVFKAFLTLDRLERTLTDLVRKDALKDVPEEKRHE